MRIVGGKGARAPFPFLYLRKLIFDCEYSILE